MQARASPCLILNAAAPAGAATVTRKGAAPGYTGTGFVSTEVTSKPCDAWTRSDSPGPNAISPFFEAKSTRMEYTGGGHFNLAYMRYTGQWMELFQDLSLDDCLATIRDNPMFQP